MAEWRSVALVVMTWPWCVVGAGHLQNLHWKLRVANTFQLFFFLLCPRNVVRRAAAVSQLLIMGLEVFVHIIYVWRKVSVPHSTARLKCQTILWRAQGKGAHYSVWKLHLRLYIQMKLFKCGKPKDFIYVPDKVFGDTLSKGQPTFS